MVWWFPMPFWEKKNQNFWEEKNQKPKYQHFGQKKWPKNEYHIKRTLVDYMKNIKLKQNTTIRWKRQNEQRNNGL